MNLKRSLLKVKNFLQVFMEYKIKEECKLEYEKWMPEVKSKVIQSGGNDYEWFQSIEQGSLYVEMFKVPSYEKYLEIKKTRQSESEPIFKSIIPFIEGGSKKIHCWAFERKE
ncbi:hypothetical protein AZF04_11430 [Alkalihalobacillus trypoxylicola]|uniref:NIPSNAP domain-containing protein n=1 Tax=Alkalihalobacillus trypoxylicola TaxID=519424 RepID=A0A162CWN6_9BACI|nr:hypothetical protein AZF04_11430 [Alkalihalobacillus trypoxylicola]